MDSKLEKQFEAIYNEYKYLVIYIASFYLKSNEKIDDVVQETFIKFFNNINNVSNYKAYITTCAKNIALDMNNKDKRNIFVSSFDDFAYENMQKNIDLKLILDNLESFLTKREINIIMAHLYGGYTFLEIGEKYNLNENTIRTLYYRALNKCKKGGLLE